MHSLEGLVIPHECEFIELSPSRLVIRHLAPVHHFVLTIGLEDLGDATRITWHMLFDSARECDAVRHIVPAFNEQNLDRLEAVLGNISKENTL
jgi:hypothetical protein